MPFEYFRGFRFNKILPRSWYWLYLHCRKSLSVFKHGKITCRGSSSSRWQVFRVFGPFHDGQKKFHVSIVVIPELLLQYFWRISCQVDPDGQPFFFSHVPYLTLGEFSQRIFYGLQQQGSNNSGCFSFTWTIFSLAVLRLIIFGHFGWWMYFESQAMWRKRTPACPCILFHHFFACTTHPTPTTVTWPSHPVSFCSGSSSFIPSFSLHSCKFVCIGVQQTFEFPGKIIVRADISLRYTIGYHGNRILYNLSGWMELKNTVCASSWMGIDLFCCVGCQLFSLPFQCWSECATPVWFFQLVYLVV